jgi:hypothetical protein
MLSRSFTFALSTSAMIVASVSAHAEIDAKKVTDAVIAQMAGSGAQMMVASSELQGSNIVIKGASIKFAGVEKPVDLGDMTLESVAEDGAGYVVGKFAFPAFDKTEGDNAFSFGGASLNNVKIAGADETDPIKKMFFYEGATIGPLKVSYKGKEAFRMDGGSFTISPYKAGEKLDMSGSFTGLRGDFTASEDPKALETMTALGYPQLEGKLDVTGSWNPADGRMAITEIFDIKDAGKFAFNFDISGYTVKFVQDMQAMNKTLEGKDDSAKGLAMMGVMQQLSLNSISMRFDDGSFTNRIIDFAAKQQNKPREEIVTQAKGVAPLIAMQLQDPDLAQKVSTAVASYLDAPKNIEIKAAPSAPISIAVLAATGAASPQALIKQLGLVVTANQ